MSESTSSFARTLRDITEVTMLCGVVYLLLSIVADFWISRGCFTEVLENAHGVSGFDFEVSETDCWHNPKITVFVSKVGQREKIPLFTYTASINKVPAIASIDENTVEIAIGKVNSVYCRRDKWKDLTIKYDVRFVRYASGDPPPNEC